MTQGSTGQKGEHIFTRLGRLARADVQPEEFFPNFFNLIRSGLAADAGSIWFYNAENRQLIPKLKADPGDGPLKGTPDDVFSNIAYQAVEKKMPILYYPEEGSELPALKDIGLMSVPVEIDEKTSLVIVLARAVGVNTLYNREDVLALQNLCFYLVLYLTQHQLRSSQVLSKQFAKLAEIESDLAGALEPEKMAFILANRSRELMFFDRVFVAIRKGSGFRIAAVSGIDDVQQNSAAVQNIRDLTTEVARLEGMWYFCESMMEKIEDVGLKGRLGLYFGTTDYKSVLLVRVEDEKGLLAMVGFERRAEGTYAQTDFQLLQSFCKISARAMRRAEDFRALPGISVARKARDLKLRAIGPARNRFWLKVAAFVAVVAILVFGRWDFTVKGDCQIQPYLKTYAAPRIDGTVREILKKEGDAVKKGDVVARLDDRDIRNRMREMQLNIDQSKQNIALFTADHDPRLPVEQKNLEILQTQLQGLQYDLEGTEITSPQDGIVVTPTAEINASLDAVRQRGAAIAEIAETSKLYVEVDVAERDVASVRPGDAIDFVVSGAPGERLHSTVETVSPSTRTSPGKNVFIVRGIVDNADGLLRPGQTGSAEIPAGKRTILYVVFRSTIDWIRIKLL